MIRRALPFALLILALATPTADAKKSAKKAIWGPVEVDGESQFPVYKDLGVGVFQMKLEWDKVATVMPEDAEDPDDTAYDWPAEVETAIAEGKRNHIKIALTVTGTPPWANGERATTVAPAKPADFAGFVTAAAKHFKDVRIWSIWDGKVSPAARYPQLLGGAYAALHKASAKNRVIGANGNARLKLANGKAARMDYFGYDPSGRRAPTEAKLAAVARRAGSHKLWLGPTRLYTSENGPFRITEAAQASWLTSAFKLVRSDSNVVVLSYDGLLDEGGAAAHGLLDVDGEKKPAYNAFKRAG